MKAPARCLFIALFLSLLAQTCWSESTAIKLSAQEIANLAITIGPLQAATEIPSFNAPAKVVVPPANDFIISVPQAGLIVKTNAAVGDKVEKGGVLALIKSPELLALQSEFLKSENAFKLASANYERDKKLRKEGVLSGREEQTTLSVLNAAKVELNQNHQLLQIGGMSSDEIKHLENSGKLVSLLNIRSPISGTVVERLAVTGAHIDPMTPLFRVANIDVLWLEINIPQDFIDEIKLGDSIRINDSSAEASVILLSQSVNPDNQTILARAAVRAGPSGLRVGQKVTVRHVHASQNGTFLVSDNGLTSHKGQTYLFVRTKDGFEAREVSVLGKLGGNSVVSGALTGNEEIATNNAAVLKADWLGMESDE